MNEIIVNSFIELHEEIQMNSSEWSKWYYRGQSSVNYDLVPKAGRDKLYFDDNVDNKIFKAWKKHAVGFIDNLSQYNDWDLLAIAQHHGLSTRLLDWSFNPLQAAYFALYGKKPTISEKHDCVIYAHYSNSEPIKAQETDAFKNSPFAVNGIRRVLPRSITPRISRQGGIFTLHNPPNLDIRKSLPQNDLLKAYVIPAKHKRQIAIELSQYGINSLSAFPDLDGLSEHINWSFANLSH